MRIVSFILLCLIWGTTWLAIKISVSGMPPFFSASARFILASIALLIIIRIKKIPFEIRRKEIRYLIISAMLMYICDYGLIYWGEQYISAGVTAIFFSTFPLFTALWSIYLFRNEKYRWHKLAGLVIGFLGILIVFYDQLVITQFNHLVVLASIAVTLAAAGGAMSVVIVKKNLMHLNAYNLTLYQMVIGIFFLVLMSALLEDRGNIQLSSNLIAAVVYLGLVGSAFAFALYFHLLKNMSVITLSLIIYITPIIAIFLDYILFREIIPFRSILGMVVVFMGIGMTQLKIKYRMEL